MLRFLLGLPPKPTTSTDTTPKPKHTTNKPKKVSDDDNKNDRPKDRSDPKTHRMCLMLALTVLPSISIAQKAVSGKEVEKQMESDMKEGRLLADLDIAYAIAYEYIDFKALNSDNKLEVLPYLDKDSIKVVFFKGIDKVICTAAFPKHFTQIAGKQYRSKRSAHQTGEVQTQPFVKYSMRSFTALERNLYQMCILTREKAIQHGQLILNDSVQYCVRPMITEYGRKVYVYPTSRIGNVLVYGGDRVIQFNTKNEIVSNTALHAHIDYVVPDAADTSEIPLPGWHSHKNESAKSPTVTDYARAFYYRTQLGWSRFVVFGKQGSFIWDFKRNQLTIVPTNDYSELITRDSTKQFSESYTQHSLAVKDSMNAAAYRTFNEGLELFKLEKIKSYGRSLLRKIGSINTIGDLNLAYIENNKYHAIFFSSENTHKVLADVSYEEDFEHSSQYIDVTHREMSLKEMHIFSVIKKASDSLSMARMLLKVPDTEYSFNAVQSKTGYNVYVLTKSTEDSIVQGNDYLVKFDVNGNLLEKRNLHQYVVANYYNLKKMNAPDTGLYIHKHDELERRELFATDICHALYYKEVANWADYLIIIDDHIYYVDCNKEKFEAWHEKDFNINFRNKLFHGRRLLFINDILASE